MATEYWYINSDNYVKLNDLTDVKSGLPDFGATVVMTMYKVSDDQTVHADLIGVSLDPMDSAGAGDYDGVLPKSGMASLADDTKYYLEVTVTGTTYDIVLREERRAKYY